MNKLLEQLAEFSQQAFDQALTAPPAIYSSTAIHELEQQRIFASEWQCVGRAAEISEIGDYISAEIGGTSIIAVRQ
ncbi:MAG: ring-hydroxylating oxygenase subunit alpha, partial [Pseudomonadales bacterium]